MELFTDIIIDLAAGTGVGRYVGKGRSHSKKKSVNFHTFGPDPPPLKSVKLKKFFFSHIN